MKLSSRPFLRKLTVATMVALIGAPSLRAQAGAAKLPPEIAPLEAKYRGEVDALAQAKDKALAPLRQSYLGALAAAEQKATAEARPDELKAAMDEKEAINAGRPLAAAAAPLLPRSLSTPRAFLLRETARVEHEYAAHAQQATAEYLRGLTFFENKARAAGQTALLEQIEAEKHRLGTQDPAGPKSAHGPGQNLVLNGDFALKKNDGTPETWMTDVQGRGAVATEHGTTFLRLTSADRKEAYFLENLDRPADVQEVQVTVRLRAREMKVPGTCGIIVAQRDGANKLVARDLPCVLTAASPNWKSLTGVVRLRPETKKVVVRCDVLESVATVDFAELHVEAR